MTTEAVVLVGAAGDGDEGAACFAFPSLREGETEGATAGCADRPLLDAADEEAGEGIGGGAAVGAAADASGFAACAMNACLQLGHRTCRPANSSGTWAGF